QELLPLVPMAYLVLASSLASSGPLGRLLGNPVVRYVGRISYGVYLWHFFVLALLFKFVPAFSILSPSPGPMRFLVAGGLTVAVAAVSWHFIEGPLNALKYRFPYGKLGIAEQRSEN